MLNYRSKERKNQLQNLTKFTERIHKEIEDMAGILNWSMESIGNNNDCFLICPYGLSHRIPRRTLSQHLACCRWKSEGYRESDTLLSEPVLSTDSPSSIKLDSPLLIDILRRAAQNDPTMKIGSAERLIPRTSDRLLTDFTSDERKVIYEYVVSNTMKPEIGQDIADIHKPKSDGKQDKELSFLELLVQERNLKRRRAKHRGVHTNKKSHTEILREVISQQMELYADYMTGIRGIARGTELPDLRRNEQPSEERSVSRCRDREKKERYLPITVVKETSNKHKHYDYKEKKRSRSRDRKSDKRHKHRSKRHSHKREHRSRETDRSTYSHSNSNYSRHRDDR